jgi:MoxR-like ATPase
MLKMDDEVRKKLDRMRGEIGARIVGNGHVMEHMLVCLLAGGHILIESPPGLGKTEMGKSVAATMDMGFKRVQCTPDLTPTDIIGETRGDAFRKGPLFTNILLVDEINRAQPKTQSALLEAMAEKTVTAAGHTHTLPEPFMVIATQNPVEYDGTFNLPEAQQDRFLLKTKMAYLSHDEEKDAIRASCSKPSLNKLFSCREVIAIQEAARQEVSVEEPIMDCIVDLVAATRARKEVMVGASTRAAVLFTQAVKAKAYLEGRMSASFHDVRDLSHAVLRHRLVMNPDASNFGYTSDDLIDDLLRKARPLS